MPERDFVAARLFCFAVKPPPAHTRTQITRRLFYSDNGIKYLCLKNIKRYAEFFGVRLYHFSVFRIVSGIHADISNSHIRILRRISLKKQRRKHGILAARNTDRNTVARLDKPVFFNGGQESRINIFKKTIVIRHIKTSKKSRAFIKPMNAPLYFLLHRDVQAQ